MYDPIRGTVLRLLCGGSVAALTAAAAMADPMPPETSLSTIDHELLDRDALWTYGSMDTYGEAPFLTDLVSAGVLPPVEERLPTEPIIYLTGAMSDGVGEYGGVFRHVSGGRPEGWNWLAGLHQGWGGVNEAVQECFVRIGPLWQVKGDQSGPLPNLVRNWEWNADYTQLDLQLMEGVRWSDGEPFDTEDVAFWWDDNVQDEGVSARMPKEGMGEGTTMEVTGPYAFRFNFTEPQGPARIESLAYIQGCPGPAHVLKQHHPKYNPDATYESYRTALAADTVPPVVLGAWVPVVYKPDEAIILRRNPYFFKVDEAGNQLPYIDEMHFKLSTWSDRTTQTVAGTADFSNMENPGNYVEALKQSQSEDAPTKVQFGPRVLSWNLELNLSETAGVNNDVDAELRRLFRDKDFRVALSHAIDRDALGQSIARGPFTYPFPGGFAAGSPYYDIESTVYYPFDPAKAETMLDALGLTDTDGNGIRNLPESGSDFEIDIVFHNEEATDWKQVDALVSMFGDVGIRVFTRGVDDLQNVLDSGEFDMAQRRHQWLIPTRATCGYLPISEACPDWHPVGDDGNRDLFDFEVEMVEAMNAFQSAWDPADRAQAARDIQRLWTENVYTVGLVQAPAALLVNKRIRNAHPGTPVFMFDWAEEGIIRERLWTPKDEQLQELLPGTIAEY
ncbi:ABC transporter substrate-binding protein [Bauldia sp.]|uniref:ABC transporter substrate-binding protein n=1 Tax=Bauldia sp. TaxID=2575872 RepID=UPI003BACECE7